MFVGEPTKQSFKNKNLNLKIYYKLLDFECLQQHVLYSYDLHVHIGCYIGMVFVDIVFDSIVDADNVVVPKRMQKLPHTVQQKPQAKQLNEIRQKIIQFELELEFELH